VIESATFLRKKAGKSSGVREKRGGRDLSWVLTSSSMMAISERREGREKVVGRGCPLSLTKTEAKVDPRSAALEKSEKHGVPLES
jgi:hypothetical protein